MARLSEKGDKMTKETVRLDLERLKAIALSKRTAANQEAVDRAVQTLEETIAILRQDQYHGLALETRLGRARQSFAHLVIIKAISLTPEERQVWETFKEKEANQATKNGLLGYLASAFRGFR